MKLRLNLFLKSLLLKAFVILSSFSVNAKDFAPVIYHKYGSSIPVHPAEATVIDLADYVNGDRFQISFAKFTDGNTWTFSLGSPVDITMNEDKTFSGYEYDYAAYEIDGYVPGFGPLKKTLSFPLFGNVFQDANTGISMSATVKNIFRGNVSGSRACNLAFNNNHSKGTNATGSTALKGGAVSFLQFEVGFLDMESLSFEGNSLHSVQPLPPGTSSQNGAAPHAFGGAAYMEKAAFENVGQLIFTDNSATSDYATASGGGLTIGEGTFNNMDSIVFDGNVAISADMTMGGGMCAEYDSTFSNIKTVSFTGNRSQITKRSGGAYGGSVGGNEGGGKHMWSDIGHILFEDNAVLLSDSMTGSTGTGGHGTGRGRLWGGAYYYSGQVTFQNSKRLEFINNRADATSDVDIISDVRGGAITTYALTIKNLVNDTNSSPAVLFSGNSALRNTPEGNKSDARGGAIDSAWLYCHSSGDMLFENNYATDLGGGIHFEGSNTLGTGSSLYLKADNGDITFKGNTHKLSASNERNSGIANAIFITPTWDTPRLDFGGNPYDTVLFAAQEGHSINFFDPIASDKSGTTLEGKSLINSHEKLRILLGVGVDEDGTPSAYTGTIRFSGEFVEETLAGSEGSADYAERVAASKVSSFDGSVDLQSGTLMLEHGVTFGKRSEDPTNREDKTGTIHRLRGGVLDISGSEKNGVSSLTGALIQFSGTEITAVRAGERARFDADIIDMKNGVSVDLAHYFMGMSVTPLSGVEVQAGLLSLGGNITIADSNNKLEYYENSRWTDKQTFTLFNISGVDEMDADASDFKKVVSGITGESAVIDCGYDGDWAYENKDGHIVAIWTPKGWVPPVDPDPTPDPTPEPTPDPTPEPSKSIRPELAGALVLNSLWSSVSNMKALGRTALGQVNNERILSQKESYYWVSGLGDFSSHGTVGTIDGYDYTGFGYAVGADTKLSHNVIVGFAFGNMYGKNKSHDFNAQVDQTSYMGTAYGAWIKEWDKENCLNILASGSYGMTENKLDTFYSDGDRAQGKWDNDAMRLTLRAEWNHTLTKDWILTPFVGVEYDEAQQKSFTETGDKARNFGRGNLKNLALPVGVQIARAFDFSHGMKWVNALALSYVPDVYRTNPEADVLRTTNDYTWTAQGVKPVRNAGRVEYATRFTFDQTWSIFAAYSLEGRSNALYHNANLGVSATF